MTGFVRFVLLFAALVTCAGCGSDSTPASPSQPAAAAADASSVIEITIEVAPNVLNLQSGGEVVTVHTSLAYGSVAAATVILNGVTIASSKADSKGLFVAKFTMADIKGLPLKIGEPNTLRLEGTTTAGKAFRGEASVLVVDVSGR